MSEINRAWLAGIFDGEGYVGIYNEGKKNKSKGEAVVVKINNTCPIMQAKIGIVLFNEDIPFGVTQQKLRSGKPLYAIVVTNMHNVNKILTIMLPHLTTKRGKAVEIMKYITGKAARV